MIVIGIWVVMVMVMVLYDVYAFVFVLVPIIWLSAQSVDVETIVVVAQVPWMVVFIWL